MLRVLILASLCAVINASLLPNFVLDYPRSLRRLFESKHAAEEKKEDERGVCKTEECKLIAQIIKGSMDETTDPCDDFYEYACGNWSKVNPLPENKTDWSLWNMVSERVNRQIKEILTSDSKPSDFFAIKLAKKWYKSCIDTDAIERRGVEPILTTLWRHGGWPLIMEDGEWDEDVYNWQIVDDQFARLIGFNAFHDLRSHSLTYGGNVTILVSTPHLPLGVERFLPFALLASLDSSDENNESGEGSQEKGSRERGQQQQNKEDSDEEQTEEEDEENEIEDKDESDWQTAEEDEEEELRKKNVVARKHRRRLNHTKRKHDKKKIANQHIRRKGTNKRTKRDLMNPKVLRKLSRHLKKADKHKVYHSVKGKLAKHSHIAHNKLNKNNNNKKKISRTNEEGHKLHKKNRKIAKRLGHSKEKNNKKKALEKHAHERKIKKLSRKGMETKVHAVKYHNHQKIANHKVHHATNKMSSLKHKKMPLSDSTKDEDSVTDISIDDENEDSDNNKEEDENKSNNDEDNEENDDEDDGSDEKEDDDDDNDNDSDDNDNDNDSDDDDNDNDSDDDDNDNDNDDDDDSEEFDEELMAEMVELYRNHILNVSILLSKGREVEIPREQMLEDIDNLIEFISKLGIITFLQDDDEEPMNTTLAELQTYYKSLGPTTPINKINWVRKIQKIFTEAGVDDIDEDTELTVVNPTYLEHLHTLLSETPSKVLVNYVHWLFISKAIIAGPQELLDLIDQWDTNFLSSSERESRCLELVQLSNVAGYEYVQRHFKEDLAKTARDMIDDIQKEVEYQVKESKWMDDDTRHFILDKLVHMKNWIGYPDWYRNTTIVKRYFRGLTIGPSFYENVINYIRYFRWKSLRQILGDENEKEIYDLWDPLELNAFFMPTENSVSITAVDLQSPFFALNRPWYVNFGIIGLIMGHEVNHGFDDSGHLFDKEGNQIEWLSAMAQAYDERAICFVNQYNEYSIIKGENYTIEDYGNRTAGENIADTMGMHAVFRAYKRRERECGKMEPALPGLEKFSNDQLFFLSFANLWCESEDREYTIRRAKYDVHSAARLRVIGPTSNSNDFAKAFNCPVGSPMNPKRKCNIW